MDTPEVVSIRDEEHECNLIDSMSINANDETTGVTSFVQEACTEMEVTGQKYVPSSIVTNSADLQDLKAYFSRPRLIASVPRYGLPGRKTPKEAR
jgi:hypothetical protein